MRNATDKIRSLAAIRKVLRNTLLNTKLKSKSHASVDQNFISYWKSIQSYENTSENTYLSDKASLIATRWNGIILSNSWELFHNTLSEIAMWPQQLLLQVKYIGNNFNNLFLHKMSSAQHVTSLIELFSVSSIHSYKICWFWICY